MVIRRRAELQHSTILYLGSEGLENQSGWRRAWLDWAHFSAVENILIHGVLLLECWIQMWSPSNTVENVRQKKYQLLFTHFIVFLVVQKILNDYMSSFLIVWTELCYQTLSCTVILPLFSSMVSLPPFQPEESQNMRHCYNQACRKKEILELFINEELEVPFACILLWWF